MKRMNEWNEWIKDEIINEKLNWIRIEHEKVHKSINDKNQWIDWRLKRVKKWEKHRIEIMQKTPNSDETNEWMKWMN